MRPDSILDGWQARVRDTVAAGGALRLRGGGSKDFYGGAPAGELLDTRAYAGIVAYEPTELVVTARCGTSLAELQATLAGKGQCLPFEPPAFGAATVGGMVAAGLSGPSRPYVGALRDYVLGVTVIDGRGDLLRFGGEVMKNVAGYDVSRLFASSLGTFGIIAEVSLKVLPRPLAGRTLALALPAGEALALVNRLAGQPLPLSAAAWHDGRLHVRLAGAAPAVDAAARSIGGEDLPDADTFWASLREQTHAFFAPALAGRQSLWRLSLPATAAAMTHALPTLIEWGGAQRWLVGELDGQALRVAAAAAGGSATRFRSSDGTPRSEAFAPRSPALAGIEARLKLAFDPAGVFNPGRLGEPISAVAG